MRALYVSSFSIYPSISEPKPLEAKLICKTWNNEISISFWPMKKYKDRSFNKKDNIHKNSVDQTNIEKYKVSSWKYTEYHIISKLE